MSAEHLHLLLNHGPIFAVAFALPLLLYGVIRRNSTVSKVALLGFVAAAVLAIPVYLSGEEAEHAVEELPGVSHDYIEEHEEAAELTLWLVSGLGLASAVVLFLSRKKPQMSNGLLAVVLLASIGVFISIAYTNNLGGKIRHSELRSGGAMQQNPEAVENEH